MLRWLGNGSVRWLAAAGLLFCAACGNQGTEKTKVIVGATLINGNVETADAVIVVDGKRIRAAGPRPTTPIPQDSDRVDGMGKFVKPDGPVTELAPDQPADLVLLGADRRVERRMVDGQWAQ